MQQPQVYSDLALVVARLLTIALRVTTRSVAAPESMRLSLDYGYRSWPTYQIEGSRQGHKEILKFYICARGASTRDDSTFLLGTRFVMETYRAEASWSSQGSVMPPAGYELVRVFRMQKYASLERSSGPSRTIDGWVFSTLIQTSLPARGLGQTFKLVPARSARAAIGAGLRGWAALTTQGVSMEGNVCPYVSLSHILERQYARIAHAS